MKCNAYHVFFGSLSNPLKIEIITALKEKSSSVMQLSKKLKIEQSKLSHALSSLKHCNIVQEEQKGKFRIYSLNKKTIIPILNIIDNHRNVFCKGCNLK
ncbi:MAG: metalloregulator ArsR/SmtB family transcription factor [Candidatus Pacearchaeota archaeon]|jgi:DNA-binding transcriptional ArsR family regulator